MRPPRRVAFRVGAALVTGVVLAAGQAGCASRTDAYCSTLKDEKAVLSQVAGGGGPSSRRSMDRVLRVFRELRDKAPADIAPDWDTLVGAFSRLSDALRAAGVDPGHFTPGKRPPGVSTGEYHEITQAALALSSTRVLAAAGRIQDEARQVCHVSLGGEAARPPGVAGPAQG
ncbi:MAG TPA: hypothetical protein VFJ19_04710 [Nocardioidaceae bacterium]|nr:hypothetical protein [Nocardioidaceae bacterium]